MTPLTDIGEMRLSESREGGKDYFFKPSFEAMSAIGNPDEIVSTFSLIHGAGIKPMIDKVSQMPISLPPQMMDALFRRSSEEILTAAMHVMRCCYRGDDDLQSLIGEWKGWRTCVVYRPGMLPKDLIIAIAQSLMHHGVIGKAKVRRLQRNESSEYSNEFRAIDYIISARNHFGMSRDDAANLTMTEFTLLLAAKYPEQKGLTKDEYDQVADDYFKNKQAKLAAAKKH
jgi:hypothetical protein